MKRVVAGFSGVLFALVPACSQAVAQFGAGVSGVVRDLHGTPQMGALVELLRPDTTVAAQTVTDIHGHYLLGAAIPGRYEVRASAALLLPAVRSNLVLLPGVRTLANLTMTAMVDIGVWFPAQNRGAEEPADDWRWTLRSTANRPLLRLDDNDPLLLSTSAEAGNAEHIQERLTVSSGEGSLGDDGEHQVFTLEHAAPSGRVEVLRADLGQTAVLGRGSSLEVSAGIERGAPQGGKTRVLAALASHPEVVGAGGSGLQVFTLASSEKITLGDAVMIDAGTLLSAERLVQSRVSASPFLKVVIAPTSGFAVMYRYATDRALQSSEDLDHVRIQPQVLGDAAGRPIAWHSVHQELAVASHEGRDTMTASLYQDQLPVAAVSGVGALGKTENLAVLVDLGSTNFRLAVPGYTAHGVSVSWTHEVSAALTTEVAAELGSALERDQTPLAPAALGGGFSPELAPAFRAEARGQIARSGTQYRVQYRWQPEGTLDTVNSFSNSLDRAYLNCSLKQRLWAGRRLQGVDAVLEATNLLEEGYQPIVGPDAQTIILAQVPRMLQAGLSFSF